MSATLQKLRERRDSLFDEVNNISETAANEDRDLTEEENKTFTQKMGQVESLDKQIVALNQIKPAGSTATVPPAKLETNYTIYNPGEKPKGISFESLKFPYKYKSLKAFTGPDAEKNAYSFGMFLLGGVLGKSKAVQYCRDNGIKIQSGGWGAETLAQGEFDNTKGGVLVPDQFEQTIIDLREAYGVFRANSRVIPMASDTFNMPRRTGGLTVYFPEENPSTGITDSTKTWDNVRLTARKAATLTLYSSEIAEDAIINIADDLAGEIAYAFALKEDQCGFIGDGTSTYGGINGIVNKINDGNHSASIATATAGHTTYASMTLIDFHQTTAILPQYAAQSADCGWYCSRVAFSIAMERLAYAGGGNTLDIIGGSSIRTFLGYPVHITQVMNATTGSNSGAIGFLFGSLPMASKFGTRRGVMISQSADRYFELDQLAIRGTERFDIVNHDLGDTSTAGPIVALKLA